MTRFVTQTSTHQHSHTVAFLHVIFSYPTPVIGIKHQFRNALFVQLTNAMTKIKELKNEKHLERKKQKQNTQHDIFF